MSKKNKFIAASVAGKAGKRAIKHAVKGINSFKKASQGLSSLNTMRGGVKGFKGFVAEEMEAAEASALGRSTTVLNNNGIADLVHTKTNGSIALKQMKVGYKPGQIDFARYKNQTVIVDKGNPNIAMLKSEGAKFGVKVVEGHVSDSEAKYLADAMQMETKITGSKNAVIAPKLYQGMKTISAAHSAGISAAKGGAVFGGGFSLGKNTVQVLRGDKSVGEAAGDVVVDTAIAGATGYGAGVAGSLIGSTATGAAAIEAVSAVGATVAGAPVVSSVISAGTAATALVGGAGTAVATGAAGLATSAVSAAATAASSAAAGTIGAGLVSSVGAGAVAATTAVGAAAVAAAPFVAVGAVVGGICCFFFSD